MSIRRRGLAVSLATSLIVGLLIAPFATTQAKFSTGKIDALTFASIKNAVISSEYDLLKNKLQLQYVDLKISLIKNNQL